jgi:predicted ArsR family transcriptional regulator
MFCVINRHGKINHWKNMKPTRLRILDYLIRHPDSTAGDLARVLRLSHADVRYHLNLLHDEGAVQITGRQRRGRGRPGRRYRLTADAPQERSDLLVNALLAVITPELAPSDREALLQQVARRLIEENPPPAEAQPVSQREHGVSGAHVIRAVEHLNRLGYRARWEARHGSPTLILAHSPFSNIEASFPWLKRLDDLLVELILGVPVQRVEGASPRSRDEGALIHYRLLVRPGAQTEG